MVYLELVSSSPDEIVYDYMPEHKDAERGRVTINPKTGERGLVSRAPLDEFTTYAGHAWLAIEQMSRSGRLEEFTYAAWY